VATLAAALAASTKLATAALLANAAAGSVGAQPGTCVIRPEALQATLAA
jgi:bifunctional ADP-heptose synthase (sugar kinase/adenylyltransferase)